MAFLQFSQVSLAFGDKDILKNVSINLQSGTKAALTGANGAGKSTLIKVMAGLIPSDSGNRSIQKNARIAYLPQSGLTHSGSTLEEEAERAFEYGYAVQEEIDRIGNELKNNNANTEYLLIRQADLITELEESGWHRRKAAAETVLLGLGFEKKDFCRLTQEFSGGWQMRIALAKALMQNPDILLLDEPTNYLDLEARSWLENFLINYKGAFLLVSHDRYFLDVTVKEVYELFNGNLKRYAGNFTHYEQVRAVELKTLIDSYWLQQQEIRKLEDFIRRFGSKASKAAQAQERQKQLDKMIRIEIPEPLKKIHFKFPPAPHSGKLVMRLKGLCKSYDGINNVIDNLDLTLESSERLVAVGKNGAGKSTLLRIIAGEDTNFLGEMIAGAGVKIGYFSQDSAETIKGNICVLDYIEEKTPLELVPKVRDMLAAFLFRSDDVFKSLDVLSGGEKSRIALLQLLLSPNNLLILDEPTNHLDMLSKDVLLDALKDFGGTVIFVSHDRSFIEGCATKVLELANGRHREFPGDYKYYIERFEAENQASAGNSEEKSKFLNTLRETKKESENQLSWQENKRLQSEKRKLEKQLEFTENEIVCLEKDKAEFEKQMAMPENYTDGEKIKKIQLEIEKIVLKLEKLNIQWENTAQEIENFSNR